MVHLTVFSYHVTYAFQSESLSVVYELSGCGIESSCSHLNSDFAPASSKEFLNIQATIECEFILKCIHDMIRTVKKDITIINAFKSI